MDTATQRKSVGTLSAFLAGLQAGMLGIGCMLIWLGLSSISQGRSFWSAENLMASVFYGGSSIRQGFATATLSGMALYVLLYSLLGALFAAIVRDRFSRGRILLLAVIFALSWYYLSFRLLWKSAMPLVALLHAERPMMFGHLIYGTLLGRYPAYLPRAEVTPEPPPVEETPAPVVEAEQREES